MSSNFFGLQTRQFVAHPQTIAEEAAFRDKVDPTLWASKAMGDMVCDWYLRATDATQDKFDRVLGNLGFLDDLHKGVPDLQLALERAESSSAMSGISGRPLGSRVRDQIVPPEATKTIRKYDPTRTMSWQTKYQADTTIVDNLPPEKKAQLMKACMPDREYIRNQHLSEWGDGMMQTDQSVWKKQLIASSRRFQSEAVGRGVAMRDIMSDVSDKYLREDMPAKKLYYGDLFCPERVADIDTYLANPSNSKEDLLAFLDIMRLLSIRVEKGMPVKTTNKSQFGTVSSRDKKLTEQENVISGQDIFERAANRLSKEGQVAAHKKAMEEAHQKERAVAEEAHRLYELAIRPDEVAPQKSVKPAEVKNKQTSQVPMQWSGFIPEPKFSSYQTHMGGNMGEIYQVNNQRKEKSNDKELNWGRTAPFGSTEVVGAMAQSVPADAVENFMRMQTRPKVGVKGLNRGAPNMGKMKTSKSMDYPWKEGAKEESASVKISKARLRASNVPIKLLEEAGFDATTEKARAYVDYKDSLELKLAREAKVNAASLTGWGQDEVKKVDLPLAGRRKV